MSIVVVEGIERSGKSFLCKALEDRGYINFKDIQRIDLRNADTIAARQDTTLSFLKELNDNNMSVVVDRYHLSEMVYGNIYRTGTSPYVGYIDSALAQMNVILVLCDVDDDYETWKERDLLDTSEEVFEEIKLGFRRAFDKSEIFNKVKVNFRERSFEEMAEAIDRMNNKYDFYLASPFFNPEQVERMNRVLSAVRSEGFTVYAPFEHGVVTSASTEDTRKETFDNNIDAIENSTRLIAITDGKDMGTIFEAGYAYGVGKDIIYFAETLGDNPFNLMLGQSAASVFKNISSLQRAVASYNFRNDIGRKGNVE